MQELYFNVALVNKQFHNITKDTTFLKSVTLKDIDEYVFENTRKALGEGTMIKKLTILQNVTNPEELLKVAFQASKVLKSLHIFASISTELAKVIVTFGKDLEHLKIQDWSWLDHPKK